VTTRRAPSEQDLAERLLARTLELVAIPSESREEAAILAHLRRQAAAGWDVEEPDGAVALLSSGRRPDASLVLLAGHVDTVPRGGAGTVTRDGDAVVGRGTADMKGGVAVAWELADAIANGEITSDLDVGVLWFAREELPITESALLPILEQHDALGEAALAIVLEPTANALEVGCLGNLNATVTVRGTAAHSARPWLGNNAIHRAIEALGSVADLPIRDVEVEGLGFRETVNITRIAGGTAGNVLPDLVTAHVNLRYAPNHTPAEAEQRLRELLGHRDVSVDIVGNAPPAPVVVDDPLVQRLRAAGELEVRPKQAWTPVAEFARVGIPAVNLGPGEPRYAHADDERVDAAALVRTYEILRSFLAGAPVEEPTR
jgi:succinyl-diaminopimelate desuccinylase